MLNAREKPAGKRGFLRAQNDQLVFEDGTVADVTASELVMGGIYDYIEVFANNHRTRCRISPVSVCALDDSRKCPISCASARPIAREINTSFCCDDMRSGAPTTPGDSFISRLARDRRNLTPAAPE